ncbi:MAG: hypothetical protein C0609_06420 [Deltaproteobacteria bacterium]|nr:MAG: hypothetical protein C0609_06420 [Deltaproteobacteria bacterium]
MLRDELKNIFGKSSVYMIGQFLSRIVAFMMIPIYTRFISPTNYGAMELIEVSTGALGMLAAMGVSEGLTRFYYGEEDESKRGVVVKTALLGIGGLGFIIIAILTLFSPLFTGVLFASGEYAWIFQVALVTVWFGLLVDICFTYLRMMYMARFFVIVTILKLFVALTLNIIFVVVLELDILGIFYSTIITQSLTGFFLCFYILRSVQGRVSFGLLKNMLLFGAPLVPARMGLMLGFLSNRFFLRYLYSGDPATALAQVGLLSLGHKFAVIINRFVTVPFNSFWGPRRHEILLSGEEGASETVARICTYSTFLTVYVALFICSGIESIIEIVATTQYKGAHVVVPFVALSYIVVGLESHFTSGMLYKKKTNNLTYISLGALAVVLVWNWYFIPAWGLIGAATSNLAGFGVRVVAIYIFSQRCYYIPFEVRRLTTLIVAGVALYGLSQLVKLESALATVLIQESIASTLPLTLLVLGFYTEGERATFLKFVGERFGGSRKSSEWIDGG